MADWYPTFLGLAGASAAQPLPLDGLDAWPTIAQGKPSPHDTILINSVGREGAVRCGDWKLVRNGKSGDEEKKGRSENRQNRQNAPDTYELFNLASDVSETNNLAAAELDKVAELSTKMDVSTREAVPPILKPEPAGTSKLDAPSSEPDRELKTRKKVSP